MSKKRTFSRFANRTYKWFFQLQIYYLARNTVIQKYAWPGLEFYVDKFPDVGACVCRTAPSSQKVRDGIPLSSKLFNTAATQAVCP